MSVKSQFLKKLHARQQTTTPFISKSQADIAAFRLQMDKLLLQMHSWLAGTGLEPESLMTSITDLLVEGGAFDIAGIVVRYDERAIKFMPIFLYGQGVTGCVEVTLHDNSLLTSLGRLFIRNGRVSGWVFSSPEALSRAEKLFDESTFFTLILALMP